MVQSMSDLSFILCICFGGFNIHSAKLIKIFLEAQSNDIFTSVTFSLGQLAGVINVLFFLSSQNVLLMWEW